MNGCYWATFDNFSQDGLARLARLARLAGLAGLPRLYWPSLDS